MFLGGLCATRRRNNLVKQIGNSQIDLSLINYAKAKIENIKIFLRQINRVIVIKLWYTYGYFLVLINSNSAFISFM